MARPEDQLTRYAKDAFDALRRDGEPAADLSRGVARTVGRQAKRLGVPLLDVRRWLQGAYGSVWVRCSRLVPGLDLRDVAAEIEAAYESEPASSRRKRKPK